MCADDQVLFDRQRGEEPPAFRHLHQPSGNDAVRRRTLDRLTEQHDGALLDLAVFGVEHGRDRFEHRRLAGTVRSEQGDDLPRAHLQRDIANGFDCACVDDLNVLKRQERRAR